MANSLNRYDAATAIPLLEKRLNSVGKTQEKMRVELNGVSQQSMHRVDIYATRGNLLRGGVESTVLKATLYSWDINITNDVPANYFTWTRNSGDSEADATWNADNSGGKKNIVIIKDDVGEQSTFTCTVTDNDKIYVQSQIIVASDHKLEGVVVEINKINESIIRIEEAANKATEAANKAKENADSAIEQMDAANAEIEAARKQLESLKGELTTLTNKMEAEYATKGELTDIEFVLSSSISQNAAQIVSRVSALENVTIGSDEAASAAITARAAADIAAEAADAAQQNYEVLQKQEGVTAEELAAAEEQVLKAKEAAEVAEDEALKAAEAAISLLDRIKSTETKLTQTADSFTFDFKTMKNELEALGGRVSTQEKYIKLVDGEIVIGQTGENASPIVAVYTNTGMDIRYNGVTVATYANKIMQVKNTAVENQSAYWGQWAVRKGNYVSDKGHNMDFVWIGG